ncbi:MAG: EAL domain-containing protein [Pseudomonadota bacterium]
MSLKAADRSARIRGRGAGEWVAFVFLLAAIVGAAYALYAYSLFKATEAMLAAAILFVAAAQIPGWLTTGARRVRKPGELSDLIKANAILSKDVQVLNQRVEEFLTQKPVLPSADLEQMADRLEQLDKQVQGLTRHMEAQPPKAARDKVLSTPAPRAPAAAPPSNFAMTPTSSLVQNAVDSGSAGLFLQPIVATSDRATLGYEASLRLLGPNGKPFDEAAVDALVKSNGHEVALDTMLLERAVRVATHFRNRGREANVICRFHDFSLASSQFLQHLIETLSRRKDLAGALWPAISQGDLALLSTQALETLAGLNDLGFRFVMDDLRDLEAKPEILRRAGFGMVRADHSFFQRATPDRDSECLALLARFRQDGVKVVANHLEDEEQMGALLNGVDAGQGTFFSAPRMVRAELAESGTASITAQAS